MEWAGRHDGSGTLSSRETLEVCERVLNTAMRCAREEEREGRREERKVGGSVGVREGRRAGGREGKAGR